MASSSIPQRETKGEYVVRRAQELINSQSFDKRLGWTGAFRIAREEYERMHAVKR